MKLLLAFVLGGEFLKNPENCSGPKSDSGWTIRKVMREWEKIMQGKKPEKKFIQGKRNEKIHAQDGPHFDIKPK